MARTRDESYDWGKDRPKGRSNFPKSYMNVEVDETSEPIGDDGRKMYVAEAHIIGPHKKGTDEYDGQPVFLRFPVGWEDDPDAEDPETWTRHNKNIRSRIAVQDLTSFEIACGVAKPDGRGVHPRELFGDCDGKKLTVFFGERVAKGYDNPFQTFTFYKFGDREPEVIGHGSNGEARATVGRRTDLDPDVDPDEVPRPRRREAEDEAPTRRARR